MLLYVRFDKVDFNWIALALLFGAKQVLNFLTWSLLDGKPFFSSAYCVNVNGKHVAQMAHVVQTNQLDKHGSKLETK